MNEIIYADIEIINLKRTYDLYFDGTMKPDELIKRVCRAFDILGEKYIVFSKRRGERLCKNMSFIEQRIAGGDTLILIILSDLEDL